MTNLSSDLKTNLDWVIAVTPIIISITVAIVGFFQYRINRQKFRLDLYNRRFAVYSKTLQYLQSHYNSKEQEENKAICKNEFIHFYRESLFLFGGDSIVYKLLTELKDTLEFLTSYNQILSETSKNDKDTLKSIVKTKEGKRDTTKIIEDLEKALIPWLDFKKIEK